MDIPVGTTVTVIVPPPSQEPEWVHVFIVLAGLITGLVVAVVTFLILCRRKAV